MNNPFLGFVQSVEDAQWMNFAACSPQNAELFVAETSGFSQEQRDNLQRAKQICKECPVKQECLDFALVTGEDVGIWGGMTYNERKVYKRPRRHPNECPNGHDKTVVGVNPQGDCRECRRQIDARYRKRRRAS